MADLTYSRHDTATQRKITLVFSGGQSTFGTGGVLEATGAAALRQVASLGLDALVAAALAAGLPDLVRRLEALHALADYLIQSESVDHPVVGGHDESN